jgi:hypothetical protein
MRERLTRQGSLELSTDIREHVLAVLSRDGRGAWVSLNDVRAAVGFKRCTEGFGRGQLNNLVAEGVLVTYQERGFLVYSLSELPQVPVDQTGLEAEADLGAKKHNNLILIAIELIDAKILEYKREVDLLSQKIAYLEQSRELLLEKEDADA